RVARALAQVLVQDDPPIAPAGQDRCPAPAAVRRLAADDTRPVEAIDADGDIARFEHPGDIADAIGLILDRLEVLADGALDRALADVAGVIAEEVDGVVIDEAERVIDAADPAGAFVDVHELCRGHGTVSRTDGQSSQTMHDSHSR